jgi:type VI secretion system protein ImpG
MSDHLLPYYRREQEAIRRLAAEFAEANPKVAGRLRLSAGAVDDPHVERLLEGMAFLAARVHHRLDDEFPELTDALLEVLYPHYLAPFPSCAVVQMVCQPDLDGPARLPAGMLLESEPVRRETCRFRTAYPVTLWPVEVESVRLSGLPLVAPANPRAAGATSVLRIALKCAAPGMSFAALGVDRLRFFIRASAGVGLSLLELLGQHVVSVALADGPTDPKPVILPADSIAPAGFEPEEALIPWSARSFSGFRLLSEYFVFPDKFLFVDVNGLDAKTLVSGGERLEVFIYLDQATPELERAVGAETLALGCTPIVNLFPQRCEPIALSHTETEYRVVADVRREAATEIWSVERVRETMPDGSFRPWRPFHRLTHGDRDAGTPGGFYHVARRDAPPPQPGSEVFLALHDPDFDVERPAQSVLSVDALCLNRDLPIDLPFGGGRPTLRLVEGAATVQRLVCLTAPTPTLRANLREKGAWRLVSHLSLGHLSVVGGEDGATALKEVLRLYDLRGSAESQAAIEALVSVSAKPGTARVPGGRSGAFCRGLDVNLEFEPRAWQTGGLYLLASVLDRFLALHATVNSFARSTVRLRGRPGRVAAWPARAGNRVLL